MAKHRFILGIDEVGRGPLAGPITICAVATMVNSKYEARNSKLFRGIKDSKALSVKKREEWFKVLRRHSRENRLFYATSSVSHSVIDKIGIARATHLAIRRSLRKIALLDSRFLIHNSRILLDGGLRAPQEYKNQQTIIGGDRRMPIIAAASIMAKVTRDRRMVRLAKVYPKYGFDIHKGYGTRAHEKALRKYGLCDIHRRSFCGKFI
ncbi:MAG: ribonuclease HII [bacterium]|nr:ribonuclease HII [bacterium]